MTVVIDTSALIELLLQRERATRVENAIGDHDLVAPDLINVEVLSALRRLLRSNAITVARGQEALDDLRDMALERVPTISLLDDIWNLRDRASAYDASYLALARVLRLPLITADAKLSRASPRDITIFMV